MYNNFYIPDQMEITEKLLTIGMDMYLQSNGQNLGMIKQKLFQLGSHFNVEDNNGNLICYAQTRFTALGVQFDVFDAQNNKIGSVVEQIIKSFLTSSNLFTVYDAWGNAVGRTQQYKTVRTHVNITNNMNQCEVKMQKTHIFKDKWTVNFYGNSIDRRILIFFPAFISMRQEEKKYNHNADLDFNF